MSVRRQERHERDEEPSLHASALARCARRGAALLGLSLGPMAAAATTRFYIYPDAAFDHSSTLECHPSWLFDDQAVEAAMLQLLRRHSSRVTDPEDRRTLLSILKFLFLAVRSHEGWGDRYLLIVNVQVVRC